MAIMIKYKVKEVATDLDVTTKEVITVLKEKLGVDKKTMTALNEDELNYIFDYFTQKNAVSDLSAYFAVRDNAIKQQEEEAAKRKEEEKKRREEEKDKLRPESAKKSGKEQTKPEQPKKEKVDKTAEIDLKSEIKSKRGTGRIVDTGAAEVNVDRYNQKYDDLALDKVKNENNMSSKKQKINQRSKQKNRRSAKRETERERMARIEKERKAKKMTVLIPEEISIGDLALRLKATVAEVVKKAFLMGTMVTANDVKRGSSTTARTLTKILSTALRSSSSWVTSTTARPLCSTISATRTLPRLRRAVSPSISAPIVSISTTVTSPSSTPPVMRRSPPCEHAALRSRISRS